MTLTSPIFVVKNTIKLRQLVGIEMTQDIVYKVKSSIYGNGRGWVFSPNDFLAFGSLKTIHQTLLRLNKAGFIRKLGRALYDYPRMHEKIGMLPAGIEQVAKAIARRDNIKILPSGAYAANMLGLSDQVPGRVVYLTDGPARRIKLGKTQIIFRKTTPKNMATAGTPAGLVIQALKNIGKKHTDKIILAKLRDRIPKKDWPMLRKSAKFAPDWIRKVILEATKESD